MAAIHDRAFLVATAVMMLAPQAPGNPDRGVENGAYRLAATVVEGGAVQVTLDDRALPFRVAEGPYLYRAQRTNDPLEERGLRAARLAIESNRLTIQGQLAGLEVEHTFTLPGNRPIMEERIRLRNGTDSTINLVTFQAGLQRRITDRSGHVLPEFAGDRWAAVPLRHRADSARLLDFSLSELIVEPGQEYRPAESWRRKKLIPASHRASEGWAWTHGGSTLGIFSFSQEVMRSSVLALEKGPEGFLLHFGGAAMVSGEPAALARVAPGQVVDLGITRYQSVPGGFVPAAYAFRALLDEKGCRFPADYNPPVHWEQLYDMEGAWDDRPHRYTREALEKEAVKGRAYGCEALYLDPGWDTSFGSFVWGADWLGPQETFTRLIHETYDLKLALHCPMPPWASSDGMSMGPFRPEDWPASCRRRPPKEAEGDGSARMVPAVREGCRNLALLPGAKATASSTLPGFAIHQVAHLNDGWYGNERSWVAATMPAWVEIDLGAVYPIGRIGLSNDQEGIFADRAATRLRIMTAVEHHPDRNGWKTVVDHPDQPLEATREFRFDPIPARWIRVEIADSNQGTVRFDEIEVYEAKPVPADQASAYDRGVRRGPRPPTVPDAGPLICMGSRQFLAEAERRLLARCAQGAAFLMFDGTWWNGPCTDSAHGHPIPYRMEDHIRACVDLARRVHARYPNVLIEMHDMLAGGSTERMTPVYYKYGLSGSYDENWGFELMWDPMADLKSGRARALYDYNLGCNVPVYLHIDLRKDNEHCVVLWWYASTCRHLGIGGTHARPEVVRAQQAAMRRYRELERFYKRGEFFGISEEIHLHVMPGEQALAVNVFNLSDVSRKVSGRIALREIGLDPARPHACTEPWAAVRNGELMVEVVLPAWSAQVAELRVRP